MDQLYCYSIHEMGLYLKGIARKDIDEWKRTRRMCFVFAKTMGSKVESEADLWAIDDCDKKKDVDWDRIDYYQKRLKELKKWSRN